MAISGMSPEERRHAGVVGMPRRARFDDLSIANRNVQGRLPKLVCHVRVLRKCLLPVRIRRKGDLLGSMKYPLDFGNSLGYTH